MPHYWPGVEGWIKAAIDHGGIGWESEDVYRFLMTRELMLWLIEEKGTLVACAVTGFEPRPRAKLCVVFFVGGSGSKAWAPLMSEIEAWAKANHCTAVQAYGRRGWERRKQPGWESVQVIFRKILE